ncbi:MAG: nucleotide exchange factor GrpE [Nitrospiraceae bacterium]|nr:nucleotide exchange factor GrpE [Nitrospiraceae bacterium]MSR23518.1 nucleotide exchange factor GrpE [Nitrospiraceae bacterium]
MPHGYLTPSRGTQVSKRQENLNTFSDLEDSEPGKSSVDQPVEETDLEQTLAARTEEAKTSQDKYLRLAAEFENFKRLAQKQKQDYSQFANESILKESLPIVDNLERALKCVQEGRTTDGLVQGVELTLKQFTETLARFGVKPIASLGVPFDPTCHQAVARQESNTVAENIVIEEYQKGYQLHDRILRAAMVVVATAQASDTHDE